MMRSIPLFVATSCITGILWVPWPRVPGAFGTPRVAAQDEVAAPPKPDYHPIDEPELEATPPRSLDDDRFGGPEDGSAPLFNAWASLAIASGDAPSGSATLISPSVGLRLALSEDVEAIADWVVGYAATDFQGVYAPESSAAVPEVYVASRERWEAGNPRIEFAWTPHFGSFFLRAGLGIAVPLAARELEPIDVQTAIRQQASELTLATMLAAHGAWNPWRFLPERMTLYLPFRVSWSSETLRFAADFGVGFGSPVLGGTDVETAMVQGALDLGVQILPALSAGARVQVAAWDLYDDRDSSKLANPFQPSVAPWVRVALGSAFAFVRVQLNAGGAYGEDPYMWAVHVGGGVSLERDETE